MKMKKIVTMMAAAAMTAAMAMTAMAAPFGSWQQNENGWWWQREDGSYPANSWVWIDGNADGTAECYYFDAVGYMVADSTTSDGYTVNVDGAWVQDGVVQRRTVAADLGDEILAAETAGSPVVTDGAVIDGKSIAPIVLNTELADLIRTEGSMEYFPNRTQGSHPLFPTVTEYKGKTLNIAGKTMVTGYSGTAGQFLTIPAQGIELDAFYENTGFKNSDGGRRAVASTGLSDMKFGLPTGSYRMTRMDIGKRVVTILLTAGTDGRWYIYPDNAATLG